MTEEQTREEYDRYLAYLKQKLCEKKIEIYDLERQIAAKKIDREVLANPPPYEDFVKMMTDERLNPPIKQK